jgi:hypothetical protein
LDIASCRLLRLLLEGTQQVCGVIHGRKMDYAKGAASVSHTDFPHTRADCPHRPPVLRIEPS